MTNDTAPPTLAPRLWLTPARVGNLVAIFDFLLLVTIYQFVYVVRMGSWNAEILTSNRHLLLVFSVLASIYLLDAWRIDPSASRWRSPQRVLVAALLAGTMIAGVFYLTALAWTSGGQSLLGRGVVLPTLLAWACVAVSIRLALHRVLARQRSQVRWLIIGQEHASALASFWAELRAHFPPESIHCWAGPPPSTIAPGTTDLPQPEPIPEGNWAGVVLTDPRDLSRSCMEQLMHARLSGLRVYTIADFTEAMWHKVPVHHLDHAWFTFAGGFELMHDRISWRVKRVGDVLVAGSVLLVTSWFMLLIALAVRLSSRGPVIYRQVRTGLHGSPFIIYKFRTMQVDAESRTGPTWATSHDPRVTWLGRILRTTRADELPQLWNILRGDMSFIGPRPERPELVVQLQQQIPYFALRHLVKPGLTGWAQINFRYGASIEDSLRKLEYDLYYLKNHSLGLDLRILARTVRVVLFGIGAR